MLEILYFFIGQFYRFIEFLDSITIFGTISFLKLLILCVLIKFVFVLLRKEK